MFDELSTMGPSDIDDDDDNDNDQNNNIEAESNTIWTHDAENKQGVDTREIVYWSEVSYYCSSLIDVLMEYAHTEAVTHTHVHSTVRSTTCGDMTQKVSWNVAEVCIARHIHDRPTNSL